MCILELKSIFNERYKEYGNDVNNFFYYLEKRYGVFPDSSNIELIMQGIETEEIKRSLDFLVNENIYKKAEAARKYATVIGQFFLFVKENSSFKNKDLFDELSQNGRNSNSYIARMNLYIEKNEKLKPKESIAVMKEADVRELLSWCDKQLLDENLWSTELGYKKANAALAVKLMLIYGFTYRKVRNIKEFQIDLDKNEIEISTFRLRFPVHLGKQIIKFLEYKKQNKIVNAQDYIFTDRFGNEWTGETTSSGIPNFLNTQFQITSITGITKYGISQLMLAGLNDQIIKTITGASDALIKGCILENEKDWYREINNKITTVDLYYDF